MSGSNSTIGVCTGVSTPPSFKNLDLELSFDNSLVNGGAHHCIESTNMPTAEIRLTVNYSGI